MANLKELKLRISSVKSTQKITKAMKMVAASKLRRARERAEQADPYAKRMERMLKTLASNVSKDNAPKLMVGTGSDKTHLLIVTSSDRGLCGGFNSALIKKVKIQANILKGQGKQFKIICIGKKAFEQLKRDFADKIIHRIDDLSKQKRMHFSDAEDIAKKVISLFENGEFDVCTVFYNKFVSAISQEPTVQQLIPFDIPQSGNDAAISSSVYEYEPSEEAILEDLLPRNLAVQIFHALLENSASEHGARMTAMDNATRNAGEMIDRLSLVYNRTRQAVITTELTEIISGAEAV